MPLGLFHAAPHVTVPAPFPGYALAFFALFAALPYIAACALWLALLLASSAGSCVALARLTGTQISAGVAVLAIPLAVIVLPYGELSSIELCALLWLAVAIRARRWTWASVWAAVAAIVPHVGIPALIGIFVWEARMRWRIAAIAVAFGLLDVFAGGAQAAIAYVTNVLPAHTLSEIAGVNQYGLTWALYASGVSGTVAVRAGEVSFAAMLLAGVIAAGALVRRSGDNAYAALIPPAFAVFGGSFMHYTEIIVALGAATLLCVRVTDRRRGLFAAALLLLALPWLSILGQPQIIAAFPLAGAAIAWMVCGFDARIALRFALGTLAICGVILICANHYGPALHAPGALTLDDSLAQASWAKFVGAVRSSAGAVWWIAKAPTWLGLALLTTACGYALRGARTPQPEVSTAGRG